MVVRVPWTSADRVGDPGGAPHTADNALSNSPPIHHPTHHPTTPPTSCEYPQEYNYHLGGVNTVTFIDDARRFVSSSDDKTLRVWEFGIPVQIKCV